MKEIILVTGASGQLGSEINEIHANYKNYQFIFTDSVELDISNLKELKKYTTANNVSYIINCAAYTNVDKAEQEFELAKKVNDTAVANLVQVAEEKNIKLIHVSTDYVFDGKSYLPLKETAVTKPIGVYGKTKRAGELHLINSKVDYLIIRTSWLYSNFKNNFVKTISKLAEERDMLGIIGDQVGTPTYAANLAETILNILPKLTADTKGVYHFSNEGVASWYDFAKEIVAISKIDCHIKPIETKDYKTLAERPSYSVLNKSKIKTTFNLEIPYWKDALVNCLEK